MMPDNMCGVYLCVCVCVCHGLSGGVSVSHNQGQVACRQFELASWPYGCTKTLISLLFPPLCLLSSAAFLCFSSPSVYFIRFILPFPYLDKNPIFFC